MSGSRASFLGPGFVGLVGLVMGCSVFYRPEGQCELDSDCIRLARTVPALQGSYCQDQVCTLPEAPKVDCETNQDCIGADAGASAVCRDYQCVSLYSGGCNLVINGKVLRSNDDVVLLGAFEKLDPYNASESAGLDSFRLAAFEMQERVQGAKGFENEWVRRPFVFVVCDNSYESSVTELDASFDYLTQVLKVPVVVTTLQQPSDLRRQWERLSGEPGFDTMFINAFGSDSALESLSSQGHIWSMLGSPIDDLAPAYVQVANKQISKVTATPVHVLTIISNTTAMKDIADVIERQIPMLGGSIATAMEAKAYGRVLVEPPGSDLSTDTGAITAALAEIDPDLVIVLGGEELIDAAIIGNEVRPQTVRTQGLGSQRYYVLSHHLSNSELLLKAVSPLGFATSLSSRLFGINYAGAKDPLLYNRYLSHLRTNNSGALEGFENYYDAAHYAMLSIVGSAVKVPTSEVRGTQAIKGFRRLIDLDHGIPGYGLEADSLVNIVGVLESNSDATLAVTGTMGPPDFSAQTGTRHTDASVWCYRPNMPSGGLLEWTADVVRYERATGTFNQDPDACLQPLE